jgi:outer membrane lipoprotein-sorting protein
MKTKILYAIVICLLLSGCKAGKSVNGSSTANASLATKDIIETHKLASPNFKTMAGRIKVEYEDDKKSQSITVSLRMEKDKQIWIKASILGITLAKVYVTKDRVSYYETISNTYFDGDFSLLSSWLGTEVDFEKTQAILLGQSIFKLDKAGYTSEVVNNSYRLQPKKPMQEFIHSIFLNPENFKVASASVAQPASDRLFAVHYGPYQKLGGSFYPSEVTINTSEGNTRTRIDVTYRDIDLNVAVSFPFDIPAGYEQIDLGR